METEIMHIKTQTKQHADKPSHTDSFEHTHTQLNTHLPTALVKACWQGEDPYSRPCKAVQRLGGVTHAEKHTHRQNKGTLLRW